MRHFFKRKREESPETETEENTKLKDVFQSTDFLFGLLFSREPYLTELEKCNHTFITTAQLNSDLLEKWHKQQITNEFRKTLNARQTWYLNFLEENKAFLLKPGGTPCFFGKEPFDILIRRTCKLLAKMPAKNTVNFILDDISMERVCSKKFEDKKDLSITSGELRAMFRTRHEKSAQFVFWRNGKKVPPPWEESKEIWGQYKNENKRQKNESSQNYAHPSNLQIK